MTNLTTLKPSPATIALVEEVAVSVVIILSAATSGVLATDAARASEAGRWRKIVGEMAAEDRSAVLRHLPLAIRYTSECVQEAMSALSRSRQSEATE